jgi:NADPH:quinone reductase-like Zn-dependent oxidoreductase
VAPPSEEDAAARGARAGFVSVQPSALQLDELAMLIDSGTVQVEVAQILPLSAAREAQALSQNGHQRGKIVLRVLEA